MARERGRGNSPNIIIGGETYYRRVALQYLVPGTKYRDLWAATSNVRTAHADTSTDTA